MEENRVQFEKWFNELWPTPDMEAHKFKLSLFLAWMASRAAIEITMPESFTAEMGAYGEADVITVAEMTEALRAAGLKIKGE
ncbi:hypothetical protein KVQ01_11330 [Escherichia coli]|uniref:hypothetical protein n=1 Tax=Escherichia coli TaxID=562 RepID=UPI001F0557FA|nr:hypothetical protein [Escherichia coli]MCH0685611.1 hypothetical protein [Escherichia coli]MDZ8667111.1 hypothetical protein [Escherichia coli]WRX87693.1 hypothetical protein SM938_22460 [Escherichia coli]